MCPWPRDHGRTKGGAPLGVRRRVRAAPAPRDQLDDPSRYGRWASATTRGPRQASGSGFETDRALAIPIDRCGRPAIAGLTRRRRGSRSGRRFAALAARRMRRERRPKPETLCRLFDPEGRHVARRLVTRPSRIWLNLGGPQIATQLRRRHQQRINDRALGCKTRVRPERASRRAARAWRRAR
jgi:hypothetical protein